MTIEVVHTSSLGRVTGTHVAEYRSAAIIEPEGPLTIAEPYREELSSKRPRKGLPRNSNIFGQRTVADVTSPDAVESFTITSSSHGYPYSEGTHDIFVGEEINTAGLGKLRWRKTEESDYPPFEEGVVEKPTPRVLKGIRAALDQGSTIQGFSLYGGLRVIRIEQGNLLRGYGENPSIDIAILHADEDFLAGGRNYKNVYGEIEHRTKTVSSQEATSQLDEWILQGNTFDSYKTVNGMIAVELKGWKEQVVPIKIEEQIRKHNMPFLWSDRGYLFESWIKQLPNRTSTIITEVVDTMEGDDPERGLNYLIVKRGESNNFDKAMKEAFDGDEFEIKDTSIETVRTDGI